MVKPLILIDEAEQDVADAYAWYEEQRPGLGDDCLAAIRAATKRVQAEPHVHLRVQGEIQRLLVERFPYSVLYREESDRVVVIAVFHAKRDPNIWKKRA
jgi:plasmid stabilization system protein ParE